MIDETKYINTAYETLYVLKHCDNSFVSKIPNQILKNLKQMAKNCSKQITLLPNKKLKEQNISEETKDFISGLYYTYIATPQEKKDILNTWQQNDKIYEEATTIDIFKNKKPASDSKQTPPQTINIIPYHNKTIFDKIALKIKKFFNK
jgi:hypothetical protein